MLCTFMCRALPYVEMMIPGNALPKVLGKGGANLDNIRRVSCNWIFSFHVLFCTKLDLRASPVCIHCFVYFSFSFVSFYGRFLEHA